MKTQDVRRLSAFGGHEEYLDHTNPRIQGLWPALIHADIEIERSEFEDSFASMIDLERRGAQLEDYPLRLYRESTYTGVNRLMDNSDWLKGKEVLYDDLEHCNNVRKSLRAVLREMIGYYEPLSSQSLLASMEMQDLGKVTCQAWKPTGWPLQSPVTKVEVPRLSRRALEILDIVTHKYMRDLKNKYPDIVSASLEELTLMDSDPPDTMTGMPTMAAGDKTHQARLDTLRAIPPYPGKDPVEYVMMLNSLGAQIGLPQGYIYSPVLSTRQGPMRKPVKLWVRYPGGYTSEYTSKALLSRTRFVYPAPFYLNFIMSPIYKQLSSARKSIPGLWHDPESQDQYMSILRKQGNQPYSIDFSGMDTAMFPHIIMAICKSLVKAGFKSDPLNIFMEAYKSMSVLLPSYAGDANSITALSGKVRPWCSGFKLTSEFDTIYGAAVLLTALEQQIPSIVSDWDSGRWTFAELGDDIIFTAPNSWKLSDSKLAADALSSWGATLEIIPDAMFLKWMLPLGGAVPKSCRPLSRFIQQTFYNEDRYTGIQGGDKPPSLMRLSLIARLTGLTDHPDWNKWWPIICPVVESLKYVRDADAAYLSALRSGKIPNLSNEDAAEVMIYANRNPSVMMRLVERAKFEPSAALTLRCFQEQGLDPEQYSDTQIRQAYWKAMMQTPSAHDVHVLQSYTESYV